MPGSSVSQRKLEKAGMTESDWILLTNRPGVVEKDVIKLLDWFIKEGILHMFCFVFFLEQKLIMCFLIIIIIIINDIVLYIIMINTELSNWRNQSVAVQEFLPRQHNWGEIG